jgi:hypothetical protein
VSDPRTDEAHAWRMIYSLQCGDELRGYYAEAKRRGISAHELRLLQERAKTLKTALPT